MLKQLVLFNNLANTEQLQEFVESLNTEALEQDIPNVCHRNDCIDIFQTLLSGLSDRDAGGKKLLIVNGILKEMENNTVPVRISEQLVSLVISKLVENISSRDVLDLIDRCLKLICSNGGSCNPYWKDLLPKLLNILIKFPCVEYHGCSMSGEECKNGIITTLIVTDWANLSTPIAGMFIETPLNDEEHERVVRKLCKKLIKLEVEEIPAFIQQLLKLTKNRNSMTLLMTLNYYFGEQLYKKVGCELNDYEKNNFKKLIATESNVLFQLTAGNQSLKEFLKIINSSLYAPEFILQPFFVTLLVVAASAWPQNETEIMGLLKTVLNRAAVEEDRIKESAWLKSIFPPALNISKLLDCVLYNCSGGRNSILKGLIALAFCLLRVSNKGRNSDSVWASGMTILQQLVQSQKCITGTVLQELGNQIAQSPDCQQYTDCLALLARKHPMALLECSSLLLNLTDISSKLSGNVGKRIVVALMPLSRLSQAVRDNLVLVLRKALFPRDEESRLMAVRGFLELVRDLKIPNIQHLSQSMSQNYCSFTQLCSQSLTGGPSPTNEGLCLEILNVLRETFKHQESVKTCFYRGLYGVFRSNPEVGPHLLDNLLTHFYTFYSSDEPVLLKFNDMVVIRGDEAVLTEPIGDLILSMALVATKIDESSQNEKLLEMLDKIGEKFSATEVSQLNLDMVDGRCILEPSADCQQKLLILKQMLLTFEALMGHVLCSWRKEGREKADSFLDLFKAYNRLCDYARSLGKTKKKGMGPKGKQPAFKFPPTILNIKCLSRLLALLNNVNVSWATEESRLKLNKKVDLHRYALQVAQQLIKDMKVSPTSEIARDCHWLGYLCKIGRTIYSKYLSQLSETKAFDLKTARDAMETFSELISLILTHFKSKFGHFLREICAAPVEGGLTSQIQTLFTILMDQYDSILSDDSPSDEESKDDNKMSLSQISIIHQLLGVLPQDTAFLSEVYEKVKKLCKEKRIENPAIAKATLTLLLTLHRRCKESGSLPLDLALSLSNSMELIDQEMTVEKHTEYNLINCSSANVCLVALCDFLNLQISEIDWTLNRLKSELSWLMMPSEAIEASVERRKENLRDREIALCRHLNLCVKVLSTLCCIAVPIGPYSDAVLKQLEVVYNKLGLATKYFMIKVGKFQESLDSVRFEKTVKLVDAELTRNMYCFTEHVIADGVGARNDSKDVNPNILKQRTLKETKLIPKVILEKEQFHKFLLQLSKKAKCDLAAKTRHTMARDYRLYTKQVKEIIEKGNMMLDEQEGSDESSPPMSKKQKRN